MKDRIKALLEDKSNKKTVKDILFKMWNDGMDFGDLGVLSALGYDIRIAEDRKIIQEYIIEYISKKIGSDDFDKIKEYWQEKVINSLPKSFTLDNGFWHVDFVVKYPKIYKTGFYEDYIFDCSIYLSDKSYYRLPDGGVNYIVDLEDTWDNENIFVEMEEEISNVLYNYILNHGLGLSESPVEDFIEDEKILREQEGEDEDSNDPMSYYIDGINDGDENIIESINDTFGGVKNFLKLLIRQHRFSEIDFTSRDLENCSRYNMVLLGLMELNTPETFKILETIVGMGDIVEENGVYYWWSDKEDWAGIFRDSRDGMSTKLIAKMLSGEFDGYEYWDPYYRKPWELYEELTPENAQRVKFKMKEILLGKTMVTEDGEMTPVLNKLLKIQKSEDGDILLNNFALDMIMNDDDSFESLFKNNSLDDDLTDEIFLPLQRLFSHAEEEVYWDSCYKKIYDEIVGSGYADNFKQGVWQQKPHRRGEQWKFDITKNLKSVLHKWLTEFQNFSDDIKYYGSYVELIKSLGDFSFEAIWAPDYADHSDAVKAFNDTYVKDEF